MKKVIIGLIAFALVITMLSFIAAGGCCFNPSDGLCSMNAEESSCSGGEFFSSESCSVTKCDRACCILGSDSRYVTSRECQILSNSFGFSYPGNWQGMEEADCTSIKDSQQKGACLYGTDFPKECKYQEEGKCGSGDFHPGVFCTDPGLDTVCKSTSKTFCYEENVYGKDSCGNPDGLRETCDYASGFICEQKSGTEAVCKDLNCKDIGKKNGESWCVNPEEALPGSRSFKQSCINGEVETEPCADFRMETCIIEGNESEARCEINPWQECLAANLEEVDEITGSRVNEEECDTQYCKIWPTEAPESEDASIPTSQIGGNLFSDLHLETCLPLVQGGLQTYNSESSTQGSSEAAEVCAQADYSATVYFNIDNPDSTWKVKNENEACNYINTQDNTNQLLGKVGVISLFGAWQEGGCYLLPTGSNNPLTRIFTGILCRADGCAPKMAALANRELSPDPMLLRVLQERCRLIADCGQKPSYVGTGGGSGTYTFHCSTDSSRANGDNDQVKCNFKFTCKPFKPSSDGSACSLCGSDDLPCSEYRCKSIGACEYHEPEGIDNGYCMAESDNSAPVIESVTLNPNSPIPPYTPVEIKIITDEAAKCKFNLKNAGAKFDDMDYDFGEGYSTEHKIFLTLPGQTAGLDEETESYNLITKDGRYTLYIRCIDPAGNGQAQPAYPVNFEVMTSPDKSAPTLSNFKPISSSRIKFNTTEKTISFEMNEPAQCRWDFEETYSLDKMKYDFVCDDVINSDPRYKYGCSGKITNVTTAFENETIVYIRCKDQPWITNGSIIENTVNYSRNEMQNAYVYRLRASERFYISELSPNGLVEANSANLNLTLTAVTQGGAFYGRANCSWRHANTSEELLLSAFTRFKVTDDSTSRQIITFPYLGENYFEVKCNDEAGNEDRLNTKMDLVIDDSSPFINALYKYSNKLTIRTDEDSLCYYSFDRVLNCLFDINNASLMSGLYSSKHEIDWIDDKTHYIKCKDIFGNYDGGCGKIIRTY